MLSKSRRGTTRRRAASCGLFGGRSVGVCTGLALTGLMAAASQAQIVNPVLQDITVDGKFSGGVTAGGALIGEWSDATPAAFISPPDNTGPLVTVPVGSSGVNSLLYAGIDRGLDNLYLMYDYLPRTNPNFLPGERFATISFPVVLPQDGRFGSGGKRNIDVQFISSLQAGASMRVNIHADATATDSAFDVDAASLGLTGALSFGPSTLSSLDHLLIELEVPLEIPANFGGAGGAFNSGGLDPVKTDSAGYSPDPAFWGGDFANNNVDPPASSALFQIMPNGSTIITPRGLPGIVPEPSALALALSGGVTGLLALRRRRNRA